MPRSLSILLVGESWFTLSLHQKGFDTFQTAEYVEGAEPFIAALEARGHQVRHIPAHLVDAQFPRSPAEFAGTDVVVLSDVGANTFLLTKETFGQSKVVPNRLVLLRDWIAQGGALLMVGGYMSFSGIDGKARYGQSPLADVLPVVLSEGDDRTEVPQGFVATVVEASHPALAGVDGQWPALLGYNRFAARTTAEVLVRSGDDPILVVGGYERGRCAAFASDLSPHWAPPGFVAWDGYGALWHALLTWLAEERTDDVQHPAAVKP